MLLKTIFDALQIVEAGDDNILERSLRHATAPGNGIGRIGITVVFRLGLNTDERRVMQTVVGAFEFQNFVASRCRPGNAASVHCDFRAAGTESHHVHRIALANLFRKLPFLLVRHPEGSSFMQLLLHGLHDGGMAMPGHQRSETQIVIDVFVPVDVVNAAALSILDENRIRLIVAVGSWSTKRGLVLYGVLRCLRALRGTLRWGGLLLSSLS